MNQYYIRFNTKHGDTDLVWRVFENDKEYLADHPGVRKDITIPDRLQYRVYEQQLKEVGFTV